MAPSSGSSGHNRLGPVKVNAGLQEYVCLPQFGHALTDMQGSNSQRIVS